MVLIFLQEGVLFPLNIIIIPCHLPIAKEGVCYHEYIDWHKSARVVVVNEISSAPALSQVIHGPVVPPSNPPQIYPPFYLNVSSSSSINSGYWDTVHMDYALGIRFCSVIGSGADVNGHQCIRMCLDNDGNGGWQLFNKIDTIQGDVNEAGSMDYWIFEKIFTLQMLFYFVKIKFDL